MHDNHFTRLTLRHSVGALFLLCTLLFAACSQDEDFSTDANLRLTFSTDTVSFDTVFSTIGSSTQRIKVFNNNDRAIHITQAYLASGGNSGFRVNIDGQSGTSLTDIDIWHEDSLFVLIDVNVNPQDASSPILITDSLIFTLESGISQQLILQAYGQDVVILRAQTFTEDTYLSADKPYVIYDSLIVDSTALLYLPAGTTLCFHSKAYLGVYGQIIAEGTIEEPITLRGDRTDKMFTYLPYDRLDAQWGGVTLYPTSGDNYLSHTDIHGGSWGIDCPTSTYTGTKLAMINSEIHNVSGNALSLVYCAAELANCQISNAGGNCVNLIGGYYEFTHCTIAQCYPWDSDYGYALFFTNVRNDTIYPLEQANFYNCLITGQAADAIQGNALEDSDAEFNASFVNCLINIELTGDEGDNVANMFSNCVNEYELFPSSSYDKEEENSIYGTAHFKNIDTETYSYDFRLDSLSTARGIGHQAYAVLYPTDKDGNERPKQGADAGCYQGIYE